MEEERIVLITTRPVKLNLSDICQRKLQKVY